MNSAAQASISKAFGLLVHFTLRPGHEREFDDLVAATMAEIEQQHEPGTLLYVTHTVDDDPQTRILYELYRGTGQRSRPTKSSPTYGSSSLSASGSSSTSRLTG